LAIKEVKDEKWGGRREGTGGREGEAAHPQKFSKVGT